MSPRGISRPGDLQLDPCRRIITSTGQDRPMSPRIRSIILLLLLTVRTSATDSV